LQALVERSFNANIAMQRVRMQTPDVTTACQSVSQFLPVAPGRAACASFPQPMCYDLLVCCIHQTKFVSQ
jgi:hypothetical protein